MREGNVGGSREFRMMLFIYNVLITLYFILSLPYYAMQMLRKKKYRAGLRQRLGFYPDPVRRALDGKRCLWVHAVSVGEVAAVMPLLKLMLEEFCGWKIVLSTVTLTGQNIAVKKTGDEIVKIYFPLDMAFAVRRAMRLVSPSLVVLVETEIWPNFLGFAAGRGIPVAIINGRISDRSYPRYRLGRFFLKRFMNWINVFSMQTELDAGRIISLGAPQERVTVAGNMKFDCGLMPLSESERMTVASSLGLDPQSDILVAGSTHGGEEEIVLRAVRELRGNGMRVELVIAPRHPERREEVRELAERMGEHCLLKSRLAPGEKIPRGAVLIVDTVGELVNFYRAATVVFVGKSLVGKGGQNIIEPASLGKPVLFGPEMQNFREAAELLLGAGGAIQVADEKGLRESLACLLGDRAARDEMGRRAAGAMARSRGATGRNLEIIRELLVRRD